ncbi:MAG: hypothetical protein Q7J20_07255 [Candidatus Nitrotoga sp.]|nr:hypothetical protein [Candidatus Nitrotoga sp.]MDO9447679.1 hypothetical protein [Candidatus Nitrotoga sp.]
MEKRFIVLLIQPDYVLSPFALSLSKGEWLQQAQPERGLYLTMPDQ